MSLELGGGGIEDLVGGKGVGGTACNQEGGGWGVRRSRQRSWALMRVDEGG